MTERLHFHFSLSRVGEGNGNPLQCSRLENPRDRGAWWAAIYGVAQSWTRLKQLSSSNSSSSSRGLLGEGNGTPLQYSCLENPMDRGAWEDLLETEMATHSSILAWRIAGTEEPSGLLFMGCHRVGHD